MAERTRHSPAAFLSYVREDDKRGRLTEFRERLEDEVRTQLGEVFFIFQDRNDIQWGQNWKSRIENALDDVTFLIPIITPSFFRSPACRDELQRFVERERALERSDLILPVYYVDTPLMNDGRRRSDDPLAQVVASRQLADWRAWRFEPFSSPEIGKLLASMAQQIRDALDCLELERNNVGQGIAGAADQPRHARSRAKDEKKGVLSFAQVASGPAKQNEPKIRVVDPLHRGDHVSISEAINAASPGERILVRAGYYQESLLLSKPLEVIGDGELTEIVVHSANQSVLLFQTTMGRVMNMTLRQSGTDNHACVDITQGRLEMEGCDVYSEAPHGLAISGGADPRIRRSRVRGGILIANHGRGTLEENEIVEGPVEISTGADPTLRRNRIYGSAGPGVLVFEKGRGTLEDNEIFGNGEAGVEITNGGDPTLRRNRIHDNSSSGIEVWSDGRGVLTDNDIYNNEMAGIEVSHGGTPVVRENRINRNGWQAAWVYSAGGGTFEKNDLRGNQRGPWDIELEDEKNFERSGNKE